MNERLSDKITDAYEKATPDMLNNIRQACEAIEQEPADSVVMFGNPKRYSYSVPQLLTAAACFILVFSLGLGIGKTSAPKTTDVPTPAESVEIIPAPVCAATVFIDVNPSISMDVSDEMKVMDCIAANEDAKQVVNDLDLKDVDVNTALSAIVGSMYMHGYLQDETRTMLVSVDSQKEGMLEEITDDMNRIFENTQVDCDLITMDVDAAKVTEEAQKNEISAGKMGLVDYIVENSEEYAKEDVAVLSKMTIGALGDIKKVVDGLAPALSAYTEAGINEVTEEIAEEIHHDIVNPIVKPIADPSVKAASEATDSFIKKTANEAIDVSAEHAKRELAKEIKDPYGIKFVSDAIDGLAGILKR